ncbi:hypothetical protein LA303_13095 [Candidatus Sulfidibacterium hydrothermale]|uniref:hypothetical protein n=1 Tax=Candidatus Sulfidibacterium hydrothermale TaxID=2875962 RepID=UPI001F0A37AB|nr:hypothetical protein [Candidatus Sulfidibacterium hydrothermale]UBM62317.1 hypothetical protein LA303_13095 [Candidatus Sulfidibacterium hydrothermale]
MLIIAVVFVALKLQKIHKTKSLNPFLFPAKRLVIFEFGACRVTHPLIYPVIFAAGSEGVPLEGRSSSLTQAKPIWSRLADSDQRKLVSRRSAKRFLPSKLSRSTRLPPKS